MTDTKKQTAVEWLVDELTALGFIDAWSDEILKARLRDGLAMEREQMEDAFKHGNLPPLLGPSLTAKEYYEETYGKEAKP